MSSDDSITLGPREHDKLGISHCGVTREGFIAVAGEPKDIEDGEEIVFERSRIRVKRTGSEYTFSKTPYVLWLVVFTVLAPSKAQPRL